MVKGATRIVVNILTVPGLVSGRLLHREASLGEHLTDWLTQIIPDHTHIVTIVEVGVRSILPDLSVDLCTIPN